MEYLLGEGQKGVPFSRKSRYHRAIEILAIGHKLIQFAYHSLHTACDAGALVGIERELTPPDPVQGNAYNSKLRGLPPDWASAIDAFAAGPIVEATLPSMLRDMLVACKRQEMATFAAQVTDFEYETYLDMV
jgi:glutamine synthetase